MWRPEMGIKTRSPNAIALFRGDLSELMRQKHIYIDAIIKSIHRQWSYAKNKSSRLSWRVVRASMPPVFILGSMPPPRGLLSR